MEVKTKFDLLLKNVPAEVVAELDRRADAHFRSRSGEILSILTTVCRNKVELPDLPIADGAAQDEPGAAQDGAQSTGDGQGGE